jgi:hypothetical protein
MGVVGFWWLVQTLPWPPLNDVFKGTAMFVLLYPVRIAMGAVIPEKKVSRRVRKRFIDKSATVPSKNEHQAASAISSLFHH